jgi:hypothetical protein
MSERKVQVSEGFYNRQSYNTLERFISYFYQIDTILRTGEKVYSVLEIGPGNKLVSRELTALGYSVTTCDFDERVSPDIVADVRELPKGTTYDLVMACQILEHISYNEFEKVLTDLAEVTEHYVLISLPERSAGIELILKVPFIQTLFKKKFFDWSMQIPVKFPGFASSGQHYWEIDGHTTTRRMVRAAFKKHFIIKKEFRPPLNKYHRFFLLEKKA